MRLSTILKGVATGLFVISLPVLFGTSSLRWLVSDTGWYKAGFQKYGVSVTTGISPEELDRTAEPISKYLLLERDRVDDIRVSIGGLVVPLFNDRENKHMVDVQKLFGRLYGLQVASGVYVLLYLVLGRLWLGKDYRRTVGLGLRWGGTTTLGLFALVGALSFADFGEFWTQLHMLVFDNDLWILDPRTDRLIMMFPEGFWYDSAIRMALATGGQALAAIAIGFLLTRRKALSYQRSAVSQ